MKIDEIKYNLDHEIGDYYENIVSYIIGLISNDQKDLAFEKLKEELAQPYIPQKTLTELEEIFETYYVKELIANNEISIEEAKDALKNLDVKNTLVSFSKLNLRMLEDEIKFFIENSDDYLSTSFLIFMLIEQKISIDLYVSKFGVKKVCNPINLEHIDDELIEKYFLLFEKNFEKNITYSKYCMEILKFYLMITYPFKLDIDFDLFDEIVNYVLKVAGEDFNEISPSFLEIIEYEKE